MKLPHHHPHPTGPMSSRSSCEKVRGIRANAVSWDGIDQLSSGSLLMPARTRLFLMALPTPVYLLCSDRRRSRAGAGRVGPEQNQGHSPVAATPLLCHPGPLLACVQSASWVQLIFYAFLISQGQCYHPKLMAIFSLRS